MRFRPAVIGMNDLPMCYFYDGGDAVEFPSSKEASEFINQHYEENRTEFGGAENTLSQDFDCVVLSEDEFFEDTSRSQL